MLKIFIKTSVVILTLGSLSSFAAAEKLPKQSPDFKGNYNYAISDRKAQPETALCSATTHDLTKNKKYKYDRFGFTQDNFNAVVLHHSKNNDLTTVKLSGEARPRVGTTKWDMITVECIVGKNTVRSISVTKQK